MKLKDLFKKKPKKIKVANKKVVKKKVKHVSRKKPAKKAIVHIEKKKSPKKQKPERRSNAKKEKTPKPRKIITHGDEILKEHSCPECGTSNVVMSVSMPGSMICRDCGAIFAELEPETEEKFEKAYWQQ